jgi:hypothetical protein
MDKFLTVVCWIVGAFIVLEVVARWIDRFVPDNTNDRYGPDVPSPMHLPRIRR